MLLSTNAVAAYEYLCEHGTILCSAQSAQPFRELRDQQLVTMWRLSCGLVISLAEAWQPIQSVRLNEALQSLNADTSRTDPQQTIVMLAILFHVPVYFVNGRYTRHPE
jgi:hypothetical protein